MAVTTYVKLPAGPFTRIGAKITASSSRYVFSAHANVAATAGSNTTSFLGGVRGEVKGSNQTKTATAYSGVWGSYWITGTNASTWPKAGVVGEVHSGVTSADAGVLAMKGSGTTCRAMFGVGDMDQDVNGATYGLDLSTNSFSPGKSSVGYTQADVRLSNGWVIMGGSGVPTNSSTGAGYAGKGSLYNDWTNGKLYINTGTNAAPTWTVVGSQS
jgi:hypothetical protein